MNITSGSLLSNMSLPMQMDVQCLAGELRRTLEEMSFALAVPAMEFSSVFMLATNTENALTVLYNAGPEAIQVSLVAKVDGFGDVGIQPREMIAALRRIGDREVVRIRDEGGELVPVECVRTGQVERCFRHSVARQVSWGMPRADVSDHIDEGALGILHEVSRFASTERSAIGRDALGSVSVTPSGIAASDNRSFVEDLHRPGCAGEVYIPRKIAELSTMRPSTGDPMAVREHPVQPGTWPQVTLSRPGWAGHFRVHPAAPQWFKAARHQLPKEDPSWCLDIPAEMIEDAAQIVERIRSEVMDQRWSAEDTMLTYGEESPVGFGTLLFTADNGRLRTSALFSEGGERIERSLPGFEIDAHHNIPAEGQEVAFDARVLRKSARFLKGAERIAMGFTQSTRLPVSLADPANARRRAWVSTFDNDRR